MQFLHSALNFPTIIFSIAMLIVILFWLTSLIGLVDLEGAEADIDADAEGQGGSWLENLGLGGVRLTISMSILVMLAWLLSIYSQTLLDYIAIDGFIHYLLGSLLAAGCLAIALPVAKLAIQPLKRFFQAQQTASQQHMIGLEGKVVTGKVTATFGQARVFFQGAEHLVEIRNPDAAQHFTQGDSILLVEYLAEHHCYMVSSKPWG